MRQNGPTASSFIISRKRFSTDLSQGGLKNPSKLLFSGKGKESNKLKRLLFHKATSVAYFVKPCQLKTKENFQETISCYKSFVYLNFIAKKLKCTSTYGTFKQNFVQSKLQTSTHTFKYSFHHFYCYCHHSMDN